MSYKRISKWTAYGERVRALVSGLVGQWDSYVTIDELAEVVNMPVTHNFRRHVEQMVEDHVLHRVYERCVDGRWRWVYHPKTEFRALIEAKDIPF